MGILDPILDPLLNLEPVYGIAIIAFVVSFIITIAYKLLTDQDEMKSLKEGLKKIQKKMKEHKKDPEKLLKIQQEAMSMNMQYMTKSLKPTIFTFIPIIIIFGWLNANMAFLPLVADQPFPITITVGDGHTEATIILPEGVSLVESTATQAVVDGTVTWVLKGGASEVPYSLSFKVGDSVVNKDIIIAENVDDRRYEKPDETYKDKSVKTLLVGNEKIRPLNLFGWKPGWLMTYIIFSVIFSMSMRKLLKIY